MKRLALYITMILFNFVKTDASAHRYPPKSAKLFEAKIAEALRYCVTNKMNTGYCIMIDMSIHSGKNRLFVYNFKKKKIIIEGLCAHGIGGGSGPNHPVYSNELNSNCTSLGKYKIGIRSYSRWGINVHYKMHGLESTNSNAFKRTVVLHSYDPVPAIETYPAPMFGVSAGCPVVANATMRKIDELIKTGQQTMLLWIYE
jgi:hypothetical protein